MVPMVVAPDDAVNCPSINIDTVLLQDSGHVFLNIDTPLEVHPFLVLGQNVPVLTYPEIKEYGFTRWMLDEKRETWAAEIRVTSIVWL